MGLIKQRLREAANLQNDGARKQIVDELASQPEETLKELIPLLEQREGELVHIALEVIRAIDYPQNISALPSLLALLATAGSPLQEEALRILVEMGPCILPVVLALKKEYPQRIFSAISEAIRLTFPLPNDSAHHAQIMQRVEHIAHMLAQDAEASLPLLIDLLSWGPKSSWMIATHTFRAIGYPSNQSCIPALLALASDSEHGPFHAVTVLSTLSPEVVIPYLLEAIYQGKDVESMCDVVSRLGKECATACGPLLCLRFSQLPLALSEDDLENRVYFLLLALKAIGSACASYALPILLDLLKKAGNSETGLSLQAFLETIDKNVIRQYERCLQRQETISEE